MRSLRVAAVGAATAMLLSSVAVSAQDSAVPCGDVDKLGYSPLTMEFDYFRFTVLGMQQVADTCGIELVVDDPSSDAAAQVSGIENLIAAGVDGVGIVSVDPVAVVTAVDAAHAAGIPVVSQVSTFEELMSTLGFPSTSSVASRDSSTAWRCLRTSRTWRPIKSQSSTPTHWARGCSIEAGSHRRPVGVGLQLRDRLRCRSVGRRHRTERGRDDPAGESGSST